MTDLVEKPVDGDVTVRGMVADVLNGTFSKGLELQAEYSSKMAAVQTDFLDVSTAPEIYAGSVSIPGVTAPVVDIPAVASTVDVMALFDGKFAEQVQILEDQCAAFLTTHFPTEQATYGAAQAWIDSSIANPSGGIPLAVQEQVLEDDKARILSESSRASDAVIELFAARGFPMPPGQAASAVLQIQQKAQDAIAESSRKISIMSIDNLKFAIEKALGLRQSALGAAIEYIKGVASGADVSSRLVGLGYDAQSKLISAASQFYTADANAKEMISKVAQYNTSLALDAATKNQASQLALITEKNRAMLAECQQIGQTVTSLMNNLHASVGISASRGSSVGYSYSNDTSGVASTVVDVG